MKKVICALLAIVMILSFAACGKEKVEEPKYDALAKSEGVMSYAQYIASEEGSEVTIEAYVQAKQLTSEQVKQRCREERFRCLCRQI